MELYFVCLERYHVLWYTNDFVYFFHYLEKRQDFSIPIVPVNRNRIANVCRKAGVKFTIFFNKYHKQLWLNVSW